MDKSLHYLRIAIGVFAITILMCVFIAPETMLRQPGLSFFGSNRSTVVPYSIGLMVTAYYLLRAAYTLSQKNDAIDKIYYRGIALIAVSLIGIVATPSWHATFVLNHIHIVFGISIFVTQAFIALTYVFSARKSLSDWVLLCIQLTAVLTALFSFNRINVVQLMLPAQLIAIIAFSVLLQRAVEYQLVQAYRNEETIPHTGIRDYDNG